MEVSQAIEEIGDFIVNEGGVGDGLGDFIAEEFAVAAAEAMGGDGEGGFLHVEGGGDLGVGGGVGLSGEGVFEGFEEGAVVVGEVLVFEAEEDLVEDGPGPALFEEAFGGHVVGGFEGVAGFGVEGVQCEQFKMATAFLGFEFVVFIEEEVFEGGEEEGAEFSFGAVDGGEGFFVEEVGEEVLGEVFGFGGGAALAADVGVEGEPVELGEFGEGLAGIGVGLRIGGGEDDGPARGGEGLAVVGGWMCERGHHASV